MRDLEFISDAKDVDLHVRDPRLQGVQQGPRPLIVIVGMPFYGG